MQSQLNAKNNNASILLIIFGVLIFLYTATRAGLLSITWDEAYTYLNFVQKGELFPAGFDHMSANNHLLITWLDILFVKCFGISEFVLRLPSLLGHILFLFFSAKLLKGFHSKGLIIASFLILNLNPYLLDFFSLARGCGLSWGLMMGSIYYLYLFLCNKKGTLYTVPAILLSLFATLANFVLLNYSLVLFVLIISLNVYSVLKSKETSVKKIITFLKTSSFAGILMISFLGFILPYLFNLKDAGALFWGGLTGFWTDTISETINRNFYELDFNIFLHWFVKGFFFLVLFFSLGFVGRNFFRKKTTTNNLFIGSILFLIIGIALCTTLQHYLFSTPYLTNRTALFFVVLFNCVFVFLMNELSKEKPNIAFITYITAFAMVLHFAFSFNLKYTLDWKFDADTKDVITNLEQLRKQDSGKNNFIIGIIDLNQTSFDFYKKIKKLAGLNFEIYNEKDKLRYDYLYLPQDSMYKMYKPMFSEMKHFPVTKNVLLKLNKEN